MINFVGRVTPNQQKGENVAHIELDLSKHCIATEVKRLHNRRITDYFKKRGTLSLLEDEIALLTRALEDLDLPALRGVNPLLAGGEPVRVVLSGNGDGGLFLTLNGDPVDLDRVRRV